MKSKKSLRIAIFLAAVFSGLFFLNFLYTQAYSQDVKPLPYSQDFSSDPGWETNNAANFKWDQASQTYYAKNVIGPNEYSVVETDYSAGSFRIEFDAKITSRDVSGETIFGLFGPDYTSFQVSPYDKPCFYVSLGGAQNRFQLVGITDSGNIYTLSSQADKVSLSKWYRIAFYYDTASNKIALKVKERDTGKWVWDEVSTGMAGLFPADMKYLGLSMAGEWVTSGISQEAYIDNLKFTLTGAISGKVTQQDGLTPIANTSINVNVYGASSYDTFWAQSQVDGAYRIPCLEPGAYQLNAYPPYGFGPLYYNNSESSQQATPIDVRTGQDTQDINFTLPPGGEIKGHVYAPDGSTALPNERISLRRSDDSRYDFGVSTDANGAYAIRVAYGGYKVKAGGNSEFQPEYYNNKPSPYAADTVSVSQGQDANNIDFTLNYGSSILGLVLNQNLNAIPDIYINSHFENLRIGTSALSNSLGRFFFRGIPDGPTEINARPDISTGLTWGTPWPQSGLFFSSSRDNLKNHPLICLDGALATGYVRDSSGNPISPGECKISSKNITAWDETDANGRYQIRVPLGTHYLSFSNQGNTSYAALPQQISVTDTSVPVALPEITVYDDTNGSNISGQIINASGLPKEGKFVIGAFDPTIPVNPDSFYGLQPVRFINDIGPGPFTLSPLPPNANYHVFFGVARLNPDYPTYMSVRDFKESVAAPATNINLNYNSIGGTVRGRVSDAAGKPVACANVVLQRQADDKFIGFSQADENGNFALYNFEPGTYSVTATYPRFSNTSTTATVTDNQVTNIPTLILTSAEGQAIRNFYANLSIAAQNEDINAFASGHFDNFLDRGDTKENRRQQLLGFFQANSDINMIFDIDSIDVAGDKAAVKESLLLTGRRASDGRTAKLRLYDGLDILKKENGEWKFFGDQELFNYEARVLYSETDTYSLSFELWSKAVDIASATVTSPGGATYTLYDDGQHSDGDANDEEYQGSVDLGVQSPRMGDAYTFNITDAGSNAYTRKFTINNIVKNKAALISPVGGATLLDNSPFKWQESPVAWAYEIQVFKESYAQENKIWRYSGIYGRKNTEVLYDADGSAKEPLLPGQDYLWRIVVHDQERNRAYSDLGAFIYAGPPAAPTNLAARIIEFDWVHLGWQDNANNESGFKVEKSRDGISFVQAEGALPASRNTYTSTYSLDPNTDYYYRVYAFNAAGNSGYSNVLKITTKKSPLKAPTNLAATAKSPTEIELSWQDNSSDETNFNIEESLDGTVFRSAYWLPANTTGYKIRYLKPNTTYYYRMRAFKDPGNRIPIKSEYSNIATAITPLPNRPPALNAIGNKQIDENKLLTFRISATDPDGDTLGYSAVNLPKGAAFDPKTQTFSWAPSLKQAGTYKATFTVSDGQATNSKAATITVKKIQVGTLSGSVSYRERYRVKYGWWGYRYVYRNIPLAGAGVIITGNGTTRTITTDRNGYYTMKDLPAGPYRITVSRGAFNGSKNTTVNAMRATRLNFNF